MAGLYLGGSQIKNVYLGTTKAKAVYLGTTQIWSASTTITASVAATADDGLALSGLNFTNGMNIGTTGSWGFARFASVAVPQGATITSATLTITAWANGSGAPDVSLGAVASDNAARPASGTDVTAAPMTTAAVTWSVASRPAAPVNLPDISTIVQEIVNRSGWQSGNAIMVIAKGLGGGNSNVVDKGETLTVTYS